MRRLLCILSGMNAGGAETFLMKIYRVLDRDRYQMDFCINVREKCFYEDEITELGGKIYRIPSKSESVKEFRRQLHSVVKDNNYKYVLRITSNAMGFMDLMIAKKAGAEVCAARSSNASDGGGMKAYIAHRLGRLMYGRYVDVKIAPSDLAAEYTFGKKAYKNGSVNILHNAIDTEIFKYSKEKRTEIREEFGIPQNAKVIGHVGRFSPQKNHGFLIDVFSEVKKKDKNTILLLVGIGELEEQIRSKVKSIDLESSVIFAGLRADIPDVLSAMDVFVFPSLYEGMPNTVIEAQACGLPCVISDRITRQANVTGSVVYCPIDDPSGWTDKIIDAYTDRIENAQEKMKSSGYDIRSAASSFAKLILERVR